MDYRTEAPPILRDFLVYHETIQAHSKKTVDEYYLDLRGFFRYLKLERRIVPADTPMEQITVRPYRFRTCPFRDNHGCVRLHELLDP